jgi:isopenicillin N synthase-like dioxygenase
MAEYAPPPNPPRLLDQRQLQHLAEHGYVGLTLPPGLAHAMEQLFAHATEFFRLPDHVKTTLYPARKGDTEQGYTQLAGEKQYLTLRYLDSPEHEQTTSTDPAAAISTAQLELTIQEAWHDTAHFLYRILHDASAHIGHISTSAWDSLVQSSLKLGRERNTHACTLMRIFQYEARGGVADPHRDLGILTLCVTKGRGLQMLQRSPGCDTKGTQSDGPRALRVGRAHVQLNEDAPSRSVTANATSPSLPSWIDAAPVVVMAGDTFRVLSSNRVPAASHRVVATEGGRQSIVFALRASTAGRIDLSQFGGFGSIDTLALWNEIRGGRVNVNAGKGTREEMRERLRKKEGKKGNATQVLSDSSYEQEQHGREGEDVA